MRQSADIKKTAVYCCSCYSASYACVTCSTVKLQWCNVEQCLKIGVHHSVHLFDGFNLESLEQPNASANSGMFRTTPFTLYTRKTTHQWRWLSHNCTMFDKFSSGLQIQQITQCATNSQCMWYTEPQWPSKYINKTRNTFCGTWYLLHNQVHNERTVPKIMAGCIVHAWNSHISTSNLKSDVTIVFFTPISIKTRTLWLFTYI